MGHPGFIFNEMISVNFDIAYGNVRESGCLIAAIAMIVTDNHIQLSACNYQKIERGTF